MQLQAIFLILTIFVSYLILGGDSNQSQDKAVDLAVSQTVVKLSFKDKISNVIVGVIIIANQNLNSLGNKADKLIALAQEIKQKKAENEETIKPDDKISSLPDKDFKHLPPEEFDSQIASYRISAEKTEAELNFNNGTKCDLQKETSLKSRTALIKYIDYNFNLFAFNFKNKANLIKILEKRKKTALELKGALEGLGFLCQPQENNSFTFLSCLCPIGLSRDRLVLSLRKKGIFTTRIWKNPIKTQPDLPLTLEISQRIINYKVFFKQKIPSELLRNQKVYFSSG